MTSADIAQGEMLQRYGGIADDVASAIHDAMVQLAREGQLAFTGSLDPEGITWRIAPAVLDLRLSTHHQ